MTEQWWIHVIGLALTLIGILILAIASLAWRTVLKIEKKQDLYIQAEAECQKSLPRIYASWDALLGSEGILTEIRRDRRDRWHSYDVHHHADAGKGPPVKA
jgi:hypothetical protein